jgi:hypothetical protein
MLDVVPSPDTREKETTAGQDTALTALPALDPQDLTLTPHREYYSIVVLQIHKLIIFSNVTAPTPAPTWYTNGASSLTSSAAAIVIGAAALAFLL